MGVGNCSGRTTGFQLIAKDLPFPRFHHFDNACVGNHRFVIGTVANNEWSGVVEIARWGLWCSGIFCAVFRLAGYADGELLLDGFDTLVKVGRDDNENLNAALLEELTTFCEAEPEWLPVRGKVKSQGDIFRPQRD